jgi:FkbM family methyltransferase
MPSASSVKHSLAPVAKAITPRRFWRRKYGILQRLGESHPDVQLARSLCDPDRISLDIGASIGEFTIAMLQSSRSVIAFEPRPAQARDLATMFEAVGAPVGIEALALSDQPGVTTMRVVADDPGRSTIDDHNTLSDLDEAGGNPVQSIDVPVKRLDDLSLDNVGLVKIDVEGHELAVLRGATDTLTRNRPAVLVEAEERHHPGAVAAITDFLIGLGYTGYFDVGGTRRPIEQFDAAEHQNPANIGGREDGWAVRGVYVNNFVFLPNS